MAHALPTNMSNMTALATYANTVTENQFWNIMLATILFCSLAIMLIRGFPKEEAFTIVSMIGLILSGMLASIGLVKSSWLFMFAIFLTMSIVLLWFRSERTVGVP